MNSNSMWTAEQILRERARREKCIGVHCVKNANILTLQQTNIANMNEMSNNDINNKHIEEDMNSWFYDIYPDHCRHATIVPLMMRGGGNVDSVPSKRGEKSNAGINLNNNNNCNCNSSSNTTSGSTNTIKKSKHSESSSKKMNGKSENLDSASPTVELASAPVSRKNSRLSFFTKGSSKHSNKNNNSANYAETDTTKHAQSGSMTAKSTTTTTTLTASTPISTSSQSLTKTPLSLPSAKGKVKEGNNTKRSSIDTTSPGTINDNLGNNNNSSTITDPQESESASAMERAIASRPTLTIITDLDDDMEYDGDVEGETNMYHTNIIKSNNNNMTSAHGNEYTHSTIATPTRINTAAGIVQPSPHDNVRLPSKTNSLLDLSRMSSMTYHHHSRYPSLNNIANSAYPITSAHDTTQHTCESMNINENQIKNNNILSPSPNSALPCLPPIDESNPLHLNNLATSSFNPNNNINNNNNLNTILFHGVSTASSHSSNHNASMHEYPVRSAHSTRYELPTLLDVHNMNSSHSFNNNNNNVSCHSNGSYILNNNTSMEGKYSTRLLEPTGSAHNNNNNNISALGETNNNNNNRCISRCPTMESIPEMRTSCHRLTATPIVPINAFVDHEARRRTALEMQRRFGNINNTTNNNTSTGSKIEEIATNDTTNVAIKDLNNNNNNENKAQSVNSAKSTVSDNVLRPSITEVSNQGNVNNNNIISISKSESVVNNNGENSESHKYESTSSLVHSPTPSMVLLSNTEIKESSRSNNKVAHSAHTTTNNAIELSKKKDKVEKSAKSTEKKNDTLSKESASKLYKSPITLNMCPRNAGKSKDYKLHPSVVNAAAVRAEAQRQAREKIIRIGAQRLQERLNELHLVTYRIKHDGNCQFRAIAQQLLGSEDYDDMIRSHVLSYMKRVRAKCFDYYFESTKAADAYFDKLSKPGSWGDELTLRAASDSLYINIHVLSSQEKNCYILYRPSEDAPPPPTFLVDVAKIRQRRRAERAWRKQQQQQQQQEIQNKNIDNALCSTNGLLLKPENMQTASSLINSVNTSQANSMEFNGYSNANSMLNSFVNNYGYWHDPMSYGNTSSSNNSNNNISSRLLLQRQETSPLLAHNLQTTSKSHFIDKNKELKENHINVDGEDEINDWNDPDAEIDACEVQRALQAKLLHKSIIVPRQFAQQGNLSLAPTAPVTRIHTPVASFNEHEYHPIMQNNNNNNNNTYVAPFTYTDLLAPHGNMPPSHTLLRPLKDQIKLNAEPHGVATETLPQLHGTSILHASSVQSMPHSTNPSQLEESNDNNRVQNNLQHEQTTFGNTNTISNNSDLLNDEPQAFVASPITRNETEPFPTLEKTSTITLDRTKFNSSITSKDNNAMHDGIAVTVPRVHNAQDALEQTNNNNNNSCCCRAMTHVGSTNSLCSTLSRFTAAGAEVQCNPTLTINLVRHTEIPMNKLHKMRNSGLQINTSIGTIPQQAHWATSSASSSLGVTPFANTLNNNLHHHNNNTVVMNIENIDSNNSFPVFQTMPNNDVMLLASSSLAANVMPVSSNITQQQQQQLLLPSLQGQQSNSHLAITNNDNSSVAHEDKMHLEHEENKSENVAGPDNMDHVCCHTMPEDTTVFNLTPNPSSLDESPYNQTPLSSTTTNATNNNSVEYQPVAINALDEEHENNLGGDVCFVFEPRTEPIDVFISYLYPVHYNALIVVESSEAAAALAANESKLPELLNDAGVNNSSNSNKSPLVAKSPMIGKSPLLQDNNSCNNSSRSAFASQSKTITSSACAPERKQVNEVNGASGNNATTTASAMRGKGVNIDTERPNTYNFITPCSTDSGLTTSSMSTLQQPLPPPPAPAQPNQVIGASFLRLKNKSFVSLPNSFSQY